MQSKFNRTLFTSLLFAALSSTPLCSSAMDAQTLLRDCIPEPSSTSSLSKVEVYVVHKGAPEETHHLVRLNDGSHLFLRPEESGDKGLFYVRESQMQWLYDPTQKALQPLTKEEPLPEWLLSELLLDTHQLSSFLLTISSQNSMGGQSYYNVTATATGDAPFPKRTLSFKVDGDQKCDLIRAAYFDANQKLRKKIYVQWQPLKETKILKALHIEDVQSLEAVRYHINEVESVDHFNPGDFPPLPD